MGVAISGTSKLRSWLAATLLVGTALLGLGAALHPMLPSDLAGQLAVIARTGSWRALHLIMLAGSALVVIGVWGQLVGQKSRPRRALTVVFAIIVCGLVLNASTIAFMAQTGVGDAARYVQGHQEAASGFARGHADAVTLARAGNALVALACIGLAIILRRDPGQPRYMSVLAAVAAIGGIIGVTAFDPASRGAVTAVALFSVWAAAAALRTLWATDAGASERGEAQTGERGAHRCTDPVAAGREKTNL